MGEFISYKKASREKNWGKTLTSADDNLNLEQINTGCMLRIAEAAEAMAKNNVDLQAALDRYKKWYEDEREAKKQLYNSIAAYKAHLTKKDKKIAALTKELGELKQRLEQQGV